MAEKNALSAEADIVNTPEEKTILDNVSKCVQSMTTSAQYSRCDSLMLEGTAPGDVVV